jgi:hypothetical protein
VKAKILTTKAKLTCPHQGTLQFHETGSGVNGKDGEILTVNTFSNATITGCSNPPVSGGPCLSVLMAQDPLGQIMKVHGEPVATEKIIAITDKGLPIQVQMTSQSLMSVSCEQDSAVAKKAAFLSETQTSSNQNQLQASSTQTQLQASSTQTQAREQRIQSVYWNKAKAKPGESVHLVGRAENFPVGTSGTFKIYLYKPTHQHALIETLSASVNDNEISTDWKFENGVSEQNQSDDNEYFFELTLGEYSAKSLLLSKRMVKLVLRNVDDIPLPNISVVVNESDGSRTELVTNTDGEALICSSDGVFTLEFADQEQLYRTELAGRIHQSLRSEDQSLLLGALSQSRKVITEAKEIYRQNYHQDIIEDINASMICSENDGINYLLRKNELIESTETQPETINANSFTIKASPPLRQITPEAMMCYTLVCQQENIVIDEISAQWQCMNDPDEDTWYRAELVKGPRGLEWRNAKWSFTGHHLIVCRVSHQGKTIDYEYLQHVVPIEEILGESPIMPEEDIDPEAVLVATRKYLKMLETIEKDFPPPEDKKQSYEKHKKEKTEYLEKLAEKLESTEGIERFLIHAEYYSRTNSSRQRLLVFASKISEKHWVIVDWTNPAQRSMTGEYHGYGSNDQEALEDAFKQWDRYDRYPDGGIVYKFVNPYDGQLFTGQIDTDDENLADTIYQFLDGIAVGSAIVVGVATLVTPIPGSRVISAAIWSSILSSTAATTINIVHRYNDGFSNLKDEVFDSLTIVGNLFGAGVAAKTLRWSKGATVLTKTSTKIVKASLIGEFATDGMQGIFLATQHYEQFKKYISGSEWSPEERVQKLLQLFASTVTTGALYYINFKGTKADIANLNTKGKSIDDVLTPAEKLNKLKNPDEEIDLTKPLKVEGHTDKSEIVVKVQTEPARFESKNKQKKVSSSLEKGNKIGEGGFGTVYEIADQPNLVMKEATASGGKVNAQLASEAKNLKLLTEKGYPTVFKEFAQWTDVDGIARQVIIMKKVDGVLSKEILQTGKFEGITPSLSSLNLVNQKTIQELKQFRAKAASDHLVIDDLQFIVDKSGSIHLIDPARVKVLSGLKPKQRKPQLQPYLKRIDRMIKGFENILPQ